MMSLVCFVLCSSPCDDDKLGVEVLALPWDGISDAEIAVYAADLARGVPVTPATLNGQQVDVRDDVEFVYRDGANVRNCKYWLSVSYVMCLKKELCIPHAECC